MDEFSWLLLHIGRPAYYVGVNDGSTEISLILPATLVERGMRRGRLACATPLPQSQRHADFLPVSFFRSVFLAHTPVRQARSRSAGC